MTWGGARGLIGGALVIAAGAAFAGAAWHYPLGTPGDLGPGAFPLAVAVAAMLFGAAICLFALFGTAPAGGAPPFRLRAPLAVIGAIAVFALLIQRLGLVPTVFAVTLVAGLGSPELGGWQRLALALFVAAACWALFLGIMGMTVPAFRLPR
jgi:putative tricarboxylic transport membrane protein